MELQGKIIYVGDITSGKSQRTGNTWHSQDAVLETPGQYPKKMAFTIFGEDRIKQFGLFAGMDCIVQFDIDAHEHKGRWYNEVRAYNVKNTGIFAKEQPQPATTPSYSAPVGATNANQQAMSEESDDLPF